MKVREITKVDILTKRVYNLLHENFGVWKSYPQDRFVYNL